MSRFGRDIEALDRASRGAGDFGGHPKVLYGREHGGGVQLCYDRACRRPMGWFDSWESAETRAAPTGGGGRFDARVVRVGGAARNGNPYKIEAERRAAAAHERRLWEKARELGLRGSTTPGEAREIFARARKALS